MTILGQLSERAKACCKSNGLCKTHHFSNMALPEQEEEASKCDEREEEVAQQGDIVALLVALGHRDVHAVLGQDVDQLRIVGQRHKCPAPVHSCELQMGTQDT